MTLNLPRLAVAPKAASVHLTPSVEPLQEKIYQDLTRLFIRGDLLPGDEFSTRALARQFGVSQMPVREAMTRLASSGLFEIRSRRKIIIPSLTQSERAELYDCRLYLESMAAKNLTLPIERARIIQLYQPLERLRRAAMDQEFSDYLVAEYDFYHCLYSFGQSRLLLGLIEQLALKSAPYRRLALKKERLRESAEAEAEIYDSLTRQSAAVFISRHQNRLTERLSASLKSTD
ncbi:MAG: GntR family transcriptional regulator [Candidatus Pacebacteria bacterium]|nr:GntR family transcriptional regulator [Candidatus Paceibacterota bacterium]